MKAIILAGGLGTRLSEETVLKPKPMVEIGGRPILWHIMQIYSSHGFNHFVVACGYKGEVIKEYFRDYFFRESDIVISLKDGSCKAVSSCVPDLEIELVDTGLDTMTGGRLLSLKRKKAIGDGTFMVTYGDGVADVDIKSLVAFHRAHGKLATITAVRPPARFGGLVLDGDRVVEFSEKPQTGEGWINGGFFVFEPGIVDYITNDQTSLERDPLERLAADGQLMSFCHAGFWQPMDTLREKQLLESLWSSGKAPWKTW
jgi:glucose-1-phosphate cytidylyltransferase